MACMTRRLRFSHGCPPGPRSALSVTSAKPGQDALEQRQGLRDLPGADERAPHRLELFPATGISDVAQLIDWAGLGRRELWMTKKMNIEEVQMAAGQLIDLGQHGVDGLRVKRFAPCEEYFFVGEVARMWTAA